METIKPKWNLSGRPDLVNINQLGLFPASVHCWKSINTSDTKEWVERFRAEKKEKVDISGCRLNNLVDPKRPLIILLLCVPFPHPTIHLVIESHNTYLRALICNGCPYVPAVNWCRWWTLFQFFSLPCFDGAEEIKGNDVCPKLYGTETCNRMSISVIVHC